MRVRVGHPGRPGDVDHPQQVQCAELSVKEDALWSPTRVVLIRFPTAAQAEQFYQSPEYQDQAVLGIGKESARRTVFFVDGV